MVIYPQGDTADHLPQGSTGPLTGAWLEAAMMQGGCYTCSAGLALGCVRTRLSAPGFLPGLHTDSV